MITRLLSEEEKGTTRLDNQKLATFIHHHLNVEDCKNKKVNSVN